MLHPLANTLPSLPLQLLSGSPAVLVLSIIEVQFSVFFFLQILVGYVCSEQDPKPLAKVCVGRCCRTVQDKPEFHVAFDVVPVHRPCLLLLSPVASFGADSDADVAGLCCTLANHALNTASLISPRHHEGFSDPFWVTMTLPWILVS